MKLRPATQRQAQHLATSIRLLKAARDYAKLADSPRYLKAIRAALRSANGAKAHIQKRLSISQTSGHISGA